MTRLCPTGDGKEQTIRTISSCALKRRASSDILQKVDKMTARLHTEVFGIIDCKQCANCCRPYPYN
jgi:hypothetical protein